MGNSSTRPEWQVAYQAAGTESGGTKLTQKANDAEAAIIRRVQILINSNDCEHDDERVEMGEALHHLCRLRQRSDNGAGLPREPSRLPRGQSS
jgi:hypothetical protein